MSADTPAFETLAVEPGKAVVTATVNGTAYPNSYIDSGSNAYFFDDAALPKGCQSSAGSTVGGWYCPPNVVRRTASFSDVLGSCRGPLSLDIACKTCLNYGIVYLRRLIGSDDNVALSVCRSAVFVALATQQGVLSYDDILTCFFGVQGITTFPGISVLAPLQLLCYNGVQLVDDFVSNARVYVYQDQFLSRRLQLLCQMPLSMILKLQRIKVFRYRRDISSSSSSLTGF
jgi:hypothetical protein